MSVLLEQLNLYRSFDLGAGLRVRFKLVSTAWGHAWKIFSFEDIQRGEVVRGNSAAGAALLAANYQAITEASWELSHGTATPAHLNFCPDAG